MTPIILSVFFYWQQEILKGSPDHYNISVSSTMINPWRSIVDESYIIRIIWTQLLTSILVMSKCHAMLNHRLSIPEKEAFDKLIFVLKVVMGMNPLHGMSHALIYISTYSFGTSCRPQCGHSPFIWCMYFKTLFFMSCFSLALWGEFTVDPWIPRTKGQ